MKYKLHKNTLLFHASNSKIGGFYDYKGIDTK